jgi:glycogen operon protein
VHAHESEVEVVLAAHERVTGYTLLWDSADEAPTPAATDYSSGDRVTMTGPSMRLFRAHGSR